MRYGLTLPNGGACGDANTLAEFANLAEEAGWDGAVFYPLTDDNWKPTEILDLSTYMTNHRSTTALFDIVISGQGRTADAVQDHSLSLRVIS